MTIDHVTLVDRLLRRWPPPTRHAWVAVYGVAIDPPGLRSQLPTSIDTWVSHPRKRM